MANYIDRAAALRDWPPCDEPADAYKYIRDFPAADVAPVRHGRYVREYDGYGNRVSDMWLCSECGCCFEDWDEMPSYNYCPNCGAKMDGGGDEE